MAFVVNSLENSLFKLAFSYSSRNMVTPFYKHVRYFEENGIISKSSIRNKWAELSGESYFNTSIKGHITMKGANYKASKKTCPYKNKKKMLTPEITSCLKHPSDSGIVLSNGNINFDVLINIMTLSFEKDEKSNVMFIRKSTILKLLTEWSLRDIKEDKYFGFMMPNSDTVAKAEWNDFFLNFVDMWVKRNDEYEPAVTADTFLQFYYESDILYQRVLNGELPVKKPLV
jgi:hypothetical protein